MDRNAMAAEIHADNIKAGWWKQVNDDSTGSSGPKRTIPRNIGELLCLTHSELSEAWTGYCTKAYDDHLPQYKQFEVELADTCIRVFDILGYYSEPSVKFQDSGIFNIPLDLPVSEQISTMHALLSESMEGFRKGDILLGKMKLWHLLDCIEHICDHREIPLEVIIETKREYNRNRADHKLENRAKPGGKAF